MYGFPDKFKSKEHLTMKKQKKSIFGALALAATMLTSVCFAGCTPSTYSLPKLDGEISTAAYAERLTYVGGVLLLGTKLAGLVKNKQVYSSF